MTSMATQTGDYVIRSYDGISWDSEHTYVPPQSFLGFIHGNGIIIAGCSSGNIRKSTDWGDTWSDPINVISSSFIYSNHMAFTGSEFVIADSSSAATICRSADGETWSSSEQYTNAGTIINGPSHGIVYVGNNTLAIHALRGGSAATPSYFWNTGSGWNRQDDPYGQSYFGNGKMGGANGRVLISRNLSGGGSQMYYFPNAAPPVVLSNTMPSLFTADRIEYDEVTDTYYLLDGAIGNTSLRLWKSSDDGVNWTMVSSVGLTDNTNNAKYHFNKELRRHVAIIHYHQLSRIAVKYSDDGINWYDGVVDPLFNSDVNSLRSSLSSS